MPDAVLAGPVDKSISFLFVRDWNDPVLVPAQRPAAFFWFGKECGLYREGFWENARYNAQTEGQNIRRNIRRSVGAVWKVRATQVMAAGPEIAVLIENIFKLQTVCPLWL